MPGTYPFIPSFFPSLESGPASSELCLTLALHCSREATGIEIGMAYSEEAGFEIRERRIV
jgi:hypothetical protein